MRAREIMTREVTSLSPDSSIREAMELLEQKEISGLPVVDRDGKFLGMLTEKEILSSILPSYIGKVGRFIYEQNPKSTKKKLGEIAHLKVAQLMRKEAITTTEDVTLCEIAHIMLVNKSRRIPVLDKSGKMLGIVTRGDVLAAFEKVAAGIDK